MQIILFYWFCCQTKGSTSVFMIPAMSEAQAAIWKKK